MMDKAIQDGKVNIKNALLQRDQERKDKLKNLKDEKELTSPDQAICNLNDFIKEVEEVTKCSICLEQVKPPVKMCMTGHGICSVPCGAQLTECPYCRSPFSKVSSRILESILKIMPKICAYSSNGCRGFTFVSNHHEQFCCYRPISCTVGDAALPCSWKGIFINWLNHAKLAHKAYIASVSVGDNNLYFPDFLKLTSRKYVHFVCGSESVLFLSSFIDNSTLHLTLQQTSYPKPTDTYSYDISFKDQGNVIFKYRLKSEIDNSDGLAGKELVNCMRVPMEEVVKFLDVDGALPVLVHILKIDYPHE